MSTFSIIILYFIQVFLFCKKNIKKMQQAKRSKRARRDRRARRREFPEEELLVIPVIVLSRVCLQKYPASQVKGAPSTHTKRACSHYASKRSTPDIIQRPPFAGYSHAREEGRNLSQLTCASSSFYLLSLTNNRGGDDTDISPSSEYPSVSSSSWESSRGSVLTLPNTRTHVVRFSLLLLPRRFD